ncbi:MAG: 50S ribosomal protein L29 [Candidatus Omnitrophica bacterium]|nr:50S ribosomal protein L29 [Candidatus Omnitrophota bacterium]
MAVLKAKDLRSLSVDELDEKAEGLRKEMFQLRLQAKLAKLEDLTKLTQARRDLAKVLTVKREMELKKNG